MTQYLELLVEVVLQKYVSSVWGGLDGRNQECGLFKEVLNNLWLIA